MVCLFPLGRFFPILPDSSRFFPLGGTGAPAPCRGGAPQALIPRGTSLPALGWLFPCGSLLPGRSFASLISLRPSFEIAAVSELTQLSQNRPSFDCFTVSLGKRVPNVQERVLNRPYDASSRLQTMVHYPSHDSEHHSLLSSITLLLLLPQITPGATASQNKRLSPGICIGTTTAAIGIIDNSQRTLYYHQGMRGLYLAHCDAGLSVFFFIHRYWAVFIIIWML